MNTKAIADAIAARFVGVTAGGAGIRTGPTADLPDTIAVAPALLVFPPTAELDVGVSRRRADVLDFPVRLLLNSPDYPRASAALYAWVDALRDRIEMDMDLGLAYVAWARPVSLTAELDGFLYAGVVHDLVELIVRVRVDEVVTTLSI